MSKHTPGPWRVAEAYGPDNDDGSPNLCFHEIRGSNGEYIGSTWAAPHVANARLIAAAPTMLEALKAFAANEPISYDDFATGCEYACECCNVAYRDRDLKHKASCPWIMAKAAIKLAEEGE